MWCNMKHSADRGRWLIKVTTNLKQKYLMEILGFTEPFAKPLPVSVYLKPDRSCVVQNPDTGHGYLHGRMQSPLYAMNGA